MILFVITGIIIKLWSTGTGQHRTGLAQIYHIEHTKTGNKYKQLENTNILISSNSIYSHSLNSRPQRERRPGILCMRMRVHYPKKGVIRVFVDTVSKINRILFVS